MKPDRPLSASPPDAATENGAERLVATGSAGRDWQRLLRRVNILWHRSNGFAILEIACVAAIVATIVFGWLTLEGRSQGALLPTATTTTLLVVTLVPAISWVVLRRMRGQLARLVRHIFGKRRIDGYCTDIVTDLAVDWLKKKRKDDKPFMLMVQHKAPHRNWMPALRHLDLYDDIDIPEPATLFDQWKDNAPPARFQQLEVDRHMDINYDLFVDLTADFNQPPSQKRQDRSAWRNMKRMSPAQLKQWRAAYAPKDAAFHKAKLTGKALVRWKFQRYAKNYLRCVKGVDESVGRLRATLKDMFDGNPPDFTLEKVEPEDWVTLSQHAVEPVRAGPFHIRTPDFPADESAIDLIIL